MTAVEARIETLWNSIPINIRKRIEDAIRYIVFYREPYKITIYKSVNPDVFIGIEDTILKLKGLGYGVEYIDGSDRVDGTDSKLIISW
jgi:hypothetical protein